MQKEISLVISYYYDWPIVEERMKIGGVRELKFLQLFKLDRLRMPHASFISSHKKTCTCQHVSSLLMAPIVKGPISFCCVFTTNSGKIID